MPQGARPGWSGFSCNRNAAPSHFTQSARLGGRFCFRRGVAQCGAVPSVLSLLPIAEPAFWFDPAGVADYS